MVVHSPRLSWHCSGLVMLLCELVWVSKGMDVVWYWGRRGWRVQIAVGCRWHWPCMSNMWTVSGLSQVGGILDVQRHFLTQQMLPWQYRKNILIFFPALVRTAVNENKQWLLGYFVLIVHLEIEPSSKINSIMKVTEIFAIKLISISGFMVMGRNHNITLGIFCAWIPQGERTCGIQTRTTVRYCGWILLPVVLAFIPQIYQAYNQYTTNMICSDWIVLVGTSTLVG